MIIQLVSVSIRPERRERWLELALEAACRTRSEPGCERFHVGEDLEHPNTFRLVEQWADMEAQYEHFRNPRFGELMAALEDLLAAPPEVTIHAVASTQTFDEALRAAGVAG
jgi:quinol monooxygenase YgiN